MQHDEIQNRGWLNGLNPGSAPGNAPITLTAGTPVFDRCVAPTLNEDAPQVEIDWWLTTIGDSGPPPAKQISLSANTKKIYFFANRNVAKSIPDCRAGFKFKWIPNNGMTQDDLRKLMRKAKFRFKELGSPWTDVTNVTPPHDENDEFEALVPINPNVPKSVKASKYLKMDVTIRLPNVGSADRVIVDNLFATNANFKLILEAEAKPNGATQWAPSVDKLADILVQLSP
jgi:hypothetical protein